jgi:hypothetical protein
MQRDDLTLYFPLMVEFWTRERETVDDDENDVDMSGYDKSRVRLA